MSNSPSVKRRDDLNFGVRASSGASKVTMAWNAFSTDDGLRSGYGNWEGDESPPKTLDYEEVLLVLAGEFGIRLQDGTVLIAAEGDVIHIPKGSTVSYFGKNAKLFFTITVPDSQK